MQINTMSTLSSRILFVAAALLTLYTSTFITMSAAVSQTCLNVTDVIPRGAFTGESFWSGRVKNILDCAIACVRRSLCMGFNFDPVVWEERANGRGTCYLFGAFPNNRTRGQIWDKFIQYSYIANWTSEIDPHCWSRPCPANSVCLPGPLGGLGDGVSTCGYTCLNFTQVCPKPTATFSGPRSVGTNITCDDGENSTCLDTLWWSYTCPSWIV